MRAAIRALAVQLRGVVGHGKVDLQQFSVADLLGVIRDFNRFGVAGAAAADGVVVGRLRRAARVAGYGIADAFDVLEHGLHAPEAAAGNHRFCLRCRGRGLVHRRGGDDERGFGGLRCARTQQAAGGGEGGAEFFGLEVHGRES
ncbi:hypothetical protein D3C72_1712850 [compost metagenome]